MRFNLLLADNGKPMAMRWQEMPGILPFDTRPSDTAPAGWYRFRTPPGIRSLTVASQGKVRCWIDGEEVFPIASNKGRQFQTGKRMVREGEVLVYSTRGNFYLTIPTSYRGPIRTGLIGPVRLLMSTTSDSR